MPDRERSDPSDERQIGERLILDDRRSLGMARFHLRRQQMRLNEIPATGEVVSLGDLGTHCRGALFSTGARRSRPRSSVHSMTCRQSSMASTSGVTTFVPGRLRTSVPDASLSSAERRHVRSDAHLRSAHRIPRGVSSVIRAVAVGVRDWRRERQAWCRDDVDPGARSTAAPVSGDGATSPRRVSGDDTRPISINAIVTSARAEQRINTSAR